MAGGRAVRTYERREGGRQQRADGERAARCWRKRGAGRRDVGRRLEHLTHINERLLSAFCVAMREQFAAGKFAPRSDAAEPRARFRFRLSECTTCSRKCYLAKESTTTIMLLTLCLIARFASERAFKRTGRREINGGSPSLEPSVNSHRLLYNILNRELLIYRSCIRVVSKNKY